MQFTISTKASPKYGDISVLCDGVPIWRDRDPDVIRAEARGIFNIGVGAQYRSAPTFELHNEMNHSLGSRPYTARPRPSPSGTS